MQKKLETKSSLLSRQGAEETPSKYQRGTDPIMDFMMTHKIPLTREAYLGLAYPDLKRGELLPPEQEADLPDLI